MTSKISMAYFILFFLISYFKNLHFGKKRSQSFQKFNKRLLGRKQYPSSKQRKKKNKANKKTRKTNKLEHDWHIDGVRVTLSLHEKMKFSIKNFFSKCDHLCSFLHFLSKSLVKNFIFSCSVYCLKVISVCFLPEDSFKFFRLFRLIMIFYIFQDLYAKKKSGNKGSISPFLSFFLLNYYSK